MKPESSDEQATRAAAEEIERLSLHGIKAVNDRDWEHKSPQAREFREHIASDFRLLSPDSSILNWEQAVEQWREKSSKWPEMQVVVTHISSDVQLREGRASVHIQSNVIRAGNSVTFAWLSQRLWRFEEGEGSAGGKWMCYEISGMRGTQSLTGFV